MYTIIMVYMNMSSVGRNTFMYHMSIQCKTNNDLPLQMCHWNTRVSFRGAGGAHPLDLFWPPLIEVAVILLLRSNRFLAPLVISGFAPLAWNDF